MTFRAACLAAPSCTSFSPRTARGHGIAVRGEPRSASNGRADLTGTTVVPPRALFPERSRSFPPAYRGVPPSRARCEPVADVSLLRSARGQLRDEEMGGSLRYASGCIDIDSPGRIGPIRAPSIPVRMIARDRPDVCKSKRMEPGLSLYIGEGLARVRGRAGGPTPWRLPGSTLVSSGA